MNLVVDESVDKLIVEVLRQAGHMYYTSPSLLQVLTMKLC